jgi:sugar phosphate isomerase/epimerase
MKILARTQMLSQYSILDSLEVIRKLGFDGVEICIEKADWSLHNLDSLPVDAIRARVAELNLSPHSFSLHQNYIYDDAFFEMTKKAIAMTRSFGTNIFVFSGVKKQTGDEAEWKRMVERTRALVDIATDHEVVLAQEFEPDFIVGTTTDLLRLFDEVPSPYLAANLDLGHAFICDSDPLQSIAQIGDKIVHCHIENMPTRLHDHLLPHEGDMNLGAFLQALAQVGFAGGMALDLYKYDYEAVASEAIAYIRRLVAQIQ